MKKLSLILLLPLLMTAVSAQAYDGPMGGMMYGFYGSYGIVPALLMWIITLLVIALLVAGIYWLVKSANKK